MLRQHPGIFAGNIHGQTRGSIKHWAPNDDHTYSRGLRCAERAIGEHLIFTIVHGAPLTSSREAAANAGMREATETDRECLAPCTPMTHVSIFHVEQHSFNIDQQRELMTRWRTRMVRG